MTSYLGDSVYVQFDGYHLVLTTDNGDGPTNRIALEPAVYEALAKFATESEFAGTEQP